MQSHPTPSWQRSALCSACAPEISRMYTVDLTLIELGIHEELVGS
jgi:hypothetical protein